MESYLTITQMNDFIFCPRSIQFHDFLRENRSPEIFKETPQIQGLAAHSTIDSGSPSRKQLLGTTVYASKYRLLGKIDLFDLESGILTERKYSITAVYPGFRYQLYAQYFALTEMGYCVKKLRLYSCKDNRMYPVPLPGRTETAEFEGILKKMREYQPEKDVSSPNPNKCRSCNYRHICICHEEFF